MKALLVRVGADQSERGGRWNGCVNTSTGEFVYTAVPERRPKAGYERPYALLSPHLELLGVAMPSHLQNACMHLDPDFEHLTYGDCNQRAAQISKKLTQGDLLVFYAGLRALNGASYLVYAIIGLYVIRRIFPARSVPSARRHQNAHTRYHPGPGVSDIIVEAEPNRSGRLKRCLPIGEYRDKAYRVKQPLLKAWGGLSVRNGYLQRSARLPEFTDAERFYAWFNSNSPELLKKNN